MKNVFHIIPLCVCVWKELPLFPPAVLEYYVCRENRLERERVFINMNAILTLVYKFTELNLYLRPTSYRACVCLVHKEAELLRV